MQDESVCPHCQNIHDNRMEEALCPLRPQQVPLMVERFGELGNGDYRITDRLLYIADGHEYTGVILWLIAPGKMGSNVQEPDPEVRYVMERDANRMTEEIYDLVAPSAIRSKVAGRPIHLRDFPLIERHH